MGPDRWTRGYGTLSTWKKLSFESSFSTWKDKSEFKALRKKKESSGLPELSFSFSVLC
jgi:hypothetical protein